MTPPIHLRPRGITLIELTVVISMIVSLISALFFSANYYKESADKAACITLITQHQKAIRSYQNLNNMSAGEDIELSEVYGEGKLFETRPTCPLGNGNYQVLGTIPIVGVPFATCVEYDPLNGSVDRSQDHRAGDLSSW